MRRGLMQWDPQELPRAVLDARLERLRATMRREKLDAFLIYTNLVRPSAVCWLTGFTPYWSEGALLVLREGAPIFCTALSKRVAEWIKSTNVVSEVTNAPRPGKLLGERLTADASVKRLGVLEFDALPTGLYDDLTEAAPALTLVDASSAFAGLRATIDESERHLLVRADALATAALDQIDPAHANDAGAVAGLVEQHARLAGAEEAYIAIAADLDADRRLLRIAKPTPLGLRFAVRASIAYKGAWVRCIRSFARDEAGCSAVSRAEAWFAETCAAIDSAKPLSAQVDAYTAALPDASLDNWMAEACVGSYPLQVVATSGNPAPQTPGDVLVLTLALTVDGVPWLGAAPIFSGQPSRN
jgi:hypothetical protein